MEDRVLTLRGLILEVNGVSAVGRAFYPCSVAFARLFYQLLVFFRMSNNDMQTTVSTVGMRNRFVRCCSPFEIGVINRI